MTLSSDSKQLVWLSISLLTIVGAATALLLGIRLTIVEPEPIAQACLAGAGGWRCAVREAVVFAFLKNVFGWTALLTGIFATISRWKWLALIAMVTGISGAVLYTYELSGFGLLLGILVWIQRTPAAREESAAHQQAQSAP